MSVLTDMTGSEIDELLIRARRSLKSHADDARSSGEPGEFRVAIATTLGVLHEIAHAHPDKAPAIEELVAEYRSEALDG